jgi:hypothetical protein
MSRIELTRQLDHVLAALTSRDHAAAPLSPAIRYTENGQQLPVGEGLWITADAIGPYRHDFIDAGSGQAACFATLTEGRTRSIMALRLKLAEGAITEIEVVAARPEAGGGGPFVRGPDRLDAAGPPDPRWFAPVPQGERHSREELCRVADRYFAGLERNDGHGDYPFHPACIRIENGFRTTAEPAAETAATGGANLRDPDTPYRLDFKAMSAKEQFETGFFAFVDRIRDRRFPVVDEKTGTVFALAFFDHSGTVREYHLADGTPATAGIDRPFTWMIAEAFRIEQGLFTRIEALMTAVPYGMRPGWPPVVAGTPDSHPA